jgi:hypothetical protein
MRVGIVVIHGIAPQARYQFEDQFATALADRLNDRDGPGTWKADSKLPPFAQSAEPESVRATFDRVSRANCDALEPTDAPEPRDAYDVFEAYWSPIDKNHTTPVSVASWLLKSVFVPLNNHARFPGSPGKVVFDVGYVLFALFFAAMLLLAMLWSAGHSYRGVVGAAIPTPSPTVSPSPCASVSPSQRSSVVPSPSPVPSASAVPTAPSLADVLVNPLKLASFFSMKETAIVLMGVVGVVCAAQAISAFLGLVLVRRAQTRRPGRRHGRALVRIAVVFAFGAALSLAAAWLPLDSGRHFGMTLWWFVGTVLALQGASALGRGFLVDRLGDVQIYTTTDENSQYFDLRERIRSEAESVLLQVIARSENGLPYYDSIVVAGHSLGSTIGLDALLRVHEIHEASQRAVSDADWGRIRAFITFGTALEKTKFFFAARRVSLSALRERWNAKLDGHLFTDDPAVLDTNNAKSANAPCGIFWLNLWYPTDIISNAIESYRSFELPRVWGNRTVSDHPVCLNQRLTIPFWHNPFPHGAYLDDERFWGALPPGDPKRSPVPLGVLDVLAKLL